MLEQRLRGQGVAAAPILEIVLFFHGQSTWESVRTACFSKVASVNFFWLVKSLNPRSVYSIIQNLSKEYIKCSYGRNCILILWK